MAKLRKLAKRNKPWKHSTGPLTKAGKDRSGANAIFMGDGIKDPNVEYSPGGAFVKMVEAMRAYDREDSDENREKVYRWAVRMLELNRDSKQARNIKISIDEWRASRVLRRFWNSLGQASSPIEDEADRCP